MYVFTRAVHGFVGDLYGSEYALWNRAADQQRYAAVDDHGIPLEPEKYQEYRASVRPACFPFFGACRLD